MHAGCLMCEMNGTNVFCAEKQAVKVVNFYGKYEYLPFIFTAIK
jgi:hypothetical protein